MPWSMSTLDQEKKLARKEKRKNYIGFHIPKIWQILKHFSGTFHQT